MVAVVSSQAPSAHGVPAAALLMIAVLIQLVLLITALKLAIRGETYETDRAALRKALVVAALYTAFLIIATGLTFLLLTFIIYAPDAVLFVMHLAGRLPIAREVPGNLRALRQDIRTASSAELPGRRGAAES